MVFALRTQYWFWTDAQHLSRQERYENGEYGWQTIGLVHGIVVILVCTIALGLKVALKSFVSSAPERADRQERNRYEHS